MIILGVVVKAYTIIIFSIVEDEVWNIKNPRPNPSKDYYAMQWEQDDFVKMKDGSYKLRPRRKVDSDIKREARKRYYDRRY